MIRVRDGGGVSALSNIRARDASGLGDVAQVYARDAGGLHPLFSTLSVSASPDFIYGFGSSSSPIEITGNSCTATVAGGSPPFTYLWVAADPSWGPTFPSNAITQFRSPALGPGEASSTTFTCEVTDAGGNTATSNIVQADAQNNGFL
jgi:hypothetical protein